MCIRDRLGPDKILGVSAHNAAEALAAQADGADYLGCGAAFVTGTKLDAHPVTAETDVYKRQEAGAAPGWQPAVRIRT